MTMTLEQLEAEVRSLKEQVAEGAYAKDYLEIWKLQSRYSHLYHIGRRSEIPALFAQKTPGVSLELEDNGVYEGIESVTRCWTELLTDRIEVGHLGLHLTLNPVIEINRDRTRARGVWHSHGYASLNDGPPLEPLRQYLLLGKYDMEYVKEDGQWKFLKLAYRLTFMCPYKEGWVDEPRASSITDSPDNKPDKPTTYHMPYSRYRVNVFQPPPPEPYAD